MKKNNTLLWKSDLGDGTYRNPVLHTDYSDPDVIRVGDTFYMTASSFNFVPGLPILVSKDLVNWKLVNYAVKHIPYEDYNKPAHGRGIWAPSIRYHNNKFYIYVGMPDEGIFMTYAEDPYGEWSPLVAVWEGKGYIDPCPFWDEDGRAYIVHAYAKSRIGFKSKLGIFSMDESGTKCTSEDRFIFDGTTTQPTIEGPKVYKQHGYYYIFAPAGGVTNGWQTVLRSEHIYGPYEEKVVMHQGVTSVNGPHQGGLVNTSSGEAWFLHFQDKGVYGRIVHLQPVFWKDNWPIIGVSNSCSDIGEPVSEYKKPSGCEGYEDCVSCEAETSDDFCGEQLSLQWQWMGNSSESYYSLEERSGYLRLYHMPSESILWNRPNVLTQKVVGKEFQVIIKMDVSGMEDGDRAGIAMLGGEYAYQMLQKEQGKFFICYVEAVRRKGIMVEKLIRKVPMPEEWNDRELFIKVDFNIGGWLRFYMSSNGEDWTMETAEYHLRKALWVGGRIGLFACGLKDSGKVGYTDFDYIRIKGK